MVEFLYFTGALKVIFLRHEVSRVISRGTLAF